MVTTQSRPLDLTPENSISIGKGRALHILWQQWENGKQFLNIYVSKATWPLPMYLPGILVPQVAYEFLAAMDEVIRQLPMEEVEHPDPENDASPLIMATQIVQRAQHYHFELSAWHQKGYQWHFGIQNVKTSEEKQEQVVYLPFWALPWLREQMATMLKEHDGSQWINEMPIIPEWATRAAPNIEQQEQQPNMEQEQMTEMEVDDAEHCSFCAVANAKKKGSKCWWHTAKSECKYLVNNSDMGNASKLGQRDYHES